MSDKKKDDKKKETRGRKPITVKIDGTLDDVLKVSVKTSEKKDKK